MEAHAFLRDPQEGRDLPVPESLPDFGEDIEFPRSECPGGGGPLTEVCECGLGGFPKIRIAVLRKQLAQQIATHLSFARERAVVVNVSRHPQKVPQPRERAVLISGMASRSHGLTETPQRHPGQPVLRCYSVPGVRQFRGGVEMMLRDQDLSARAPKSLHSAPRTLIHTEQVFKLTGLCAFVPNPCSFFASPRLSQIKGQQQRHEAAQRPEAGSADGLFRDRQVLNHGVALVLFEREFGPDTEGRREALIP